MKTRINNSLDILVWLDKFFVWPILLYRIYRFGSAFRKIYLGLGYFTMLDPDDYYRVKHFKWWVHSNGSNLYAARTAITPDLKSRIIYLHRQIMNPPEDLVVDHRFGDTLDNRKQNLRIVTQAENMRNRRKRKNTSSRFIGVSFRKKRRNWDGNIRVNGRKLWLGAFDNEIDAAKAYDRAAIKFIGEFAKLNFPKKIEWSPKPRKIQRISGTKVLGIPKHRDSRGRLNLRLANWLGARLNFPRENYVNEICLHSR